MRACPCCLEPLTSGILGLGGRRLTGTCAVCGDAVCQTCVGTRALDAGAPRKRVCRSCLWEHLADRGETPPFPAPPGQRERAARAARESCVHPRVKQCMGFCPDCGDEVDWKDEHGNPACDACGAPSHPLFNCCWACGESFEEDHEPRPVARGYRLEFDCDAANCTGKLAWLMPFCPWCGEARHWQHPGNGGLECMKCESSLDRGWVFCVHCGEETPLPEDCARCAQGLEEAQSAARCEDCRNIVCGDCFDLRVVPGEFGAKHEKLLCSTCGVRFDRAADTVEPQAEAEEPRADADDDAPEADEDEADAPEEDEDEPEDEPEADEEAPREPAAPRDAPPPSPWEVLGVPPQTPLPEVRRAYLALVAQYHPDKVAQLGPKLQALAQDETRRIIEAWERVRKQSR
ncbi:J domain-containing protein [Pyxidicoccus trucidator]|uniref:J domain-containing protein n=1 Tax=Pyxidicoccus trucidator TaxID=2709662 RepID=UPI0013DBABF6|nr:J domain-containing protein [Pyxidicoccus trucidator]